MYLIFQFQFTTIEDINKSKHIMRVKLGGMSRPKVMLLRSPTRKKVEKPLIRIKAKTVKTDNYTPLNKNLLKLYICSFLLKILTESAETISQGN